MAGKSFLATATCGVLLWLALSPAAAGEAAAPKPVASDELIDRLANGGVVYTFDDYEAFIQLDVKGDCGSHTRLRVHFDGLYVVPEPHLSWFIREGMAVNPKLRDCYTVYPKKISVSAQAHIVQEVLEDDGNIIRHVTNTIRWSFSDSYSLPVPPEAPKEPEDVNDISDWKRQVNQCRRDHKFLGFFMIADRRAIGGDVKAGPQFTLLDRQGGRAHTLVNGLERSTGRTWHASRSTTSTCSCWRPSWTFWRKS